jgi:sterol desaturase/sphingolipid hydroxylase (fatty acid hydroxylase superfamily)
MTIQLSSSALALVAVFLLLTVLETLRPLRRPKRAWGPRWVLNGAVTALAFITGAFTVRPVALGAAAWIEGQGFGLLHLLPLPFWARLAAGVLLMDLTFYHWHRLNHTRPLLWRFHNVHHLDPDLDLSTSFRFHFGEVLYSTGFRLLQVGLLGVLPVTYLTYEVLFNCATMFRTPVSVEVTPSMHRCILFTGRPETNSNYSVVFSLWDRLHRSLRLNVKQAEVVIGVPGYLLPRDNRLFPLLTLPFTGQRRYWRWPSGKAPSGYPAAPPPSWLE